MTKQEAVHAMKEGKKVTHRYFSDEEWITMEGIRMYDEQGYSFYPEEFWRHRTETAFDKDWTIYEEPTK